MPLIQLEYQYDGALQGEVWGNLWGMKCELSQVIYGTFDYFCGVSCQYEMKTIKLRYVK